MEWLEGVTREAEVAGSDSSGREACISVGPSGIKKKLAIFWPGFENSGNGFVGAAQIVSRLYK